MDVCGNPDFSKQCVRPEISDEVTKQLKQRTSTSAVVHGRLSPGCADAEANSDSGERYVRSKISEETNPAAEVGDLTGKSAGS